MSISRDFVFEDNIPTDNTDFSVLGELQGRQSKTISTYEKFVNYKLREEINNGIRFFDKLN